MSEQLSAQPRARSWTRHSLLCLLVFTVVLAARLFYVESYAVSLPYWDQWDAEGAKLIRPYEKGILPIRELWATHNEHRILPTRLTFLALYGITGEWNNLHGARFNAFLCASLAAFLIWVPTRTLTRPAVRWLTAAVVAASFSLPFAYENILVGFQSQFYYLLLFTVAASALAAWRPGDPTAMAGVLMASVAAVLTMASGLLTPIAAAGVYMLARYANRTRMPATEIVMVLALLALALLSYSTTPVLEGHRELMAKDARATVDATTHMLGFPADGYHWTFLWLWLPGVCGLLVRVLRRDLEVSDFIMASLLGWSAVQAVAIAYGRGNGLIEVPSRYAELMTPGLVASTWFIVRALDLGWRSEAMRWVTAIGCAGSLTVFSTAHIARFESDIRFLEERRALSEIQVYNVRRYLISGDPAVLHQPRLHIPHYHPVRLQSLLDDRLLRASLPVEIRNPETTPSRKDPAETTAGGAQE